jgi:hypothetical protein
MAKSTLHTIRLHTSAAECRPSPLHVMSAEGWQRDAGGRITAAGGGYSLRAHGGPRCLCTACSVEKAVLLAARAGWVRSEWLPA